MSNNFWNNQSEPVSEYDMMSEEIEDQAQQILDEYSDEPEEEYEEYEEYEEETMSDYEPAKRKSVYKLNKQQNSVVNDAMIRLEQARLYDMLIKHDLFKGVKAHPIALANVKKELKDYIVSRLEILIGLRKEKKEVEIPKNIELELPFNEVEVEFLKALSMKGTKGASTKYGHGIVLRANLKNQTEPANEYEEEYEEEYQGLHPLSYDEPEEEYEEEIEEPAPLPSPKKVVRKKPAPKRKPTPKKPAAKKRPAPKKKAAAPKKHKPSRAKLNRKGEISDAEAERIAREDMERMKGRKPAHEMNAQELMEANKRIKSNKTNVPGQKPILNFEQQNMYYQQQAMNNQSAQINNPGAMIQNKLLQKILSEKN